MTAPNLSARELRRVVTAAAVGNGSGGGVPVEPFPDAGDAQAQHLGAGGGVGL